MAGESALFAFGERANAARLRPSPLTIHRKVPLLRSERWLLESAASTMRAGVGLAVAIG